MGMVNGGWSSLRARWRRVEPIALLIAGTAVVVLMFGAVIFIAQAGSDRIAPAAAPTFIAGDTANDRSLQDFTKRCEESSVNWREARLDYPKSVGARVGQSVVYHVAIDARTLPAPAPVVLGVEAGAGGLHAQVKGESSPDLILVTQPIMVSCEVKARLTAVDDGLKIAPPDGGEQWIAYAIGPTGLIEWSWTVGMEKVDFHQLKLEFKPVIESRHLNIPQNTQIIARTVDVHVTGDWLDRATAWVQRHKTAIVTLVGTAAAFLLTLFGWLAKAAEAWTKLRAVTPWKKSTTKKQPRTTPAKKAAQPAASSKSASSRGTPPGAP